MNYPCKNCKDDRYPGCHDHCEAYLEVKAKHDEYKAEQRRRKEAEDYTVETVCKINDLGNKSKRRGRKHER